MNLETDLRTWCQTRNDDLFTDKIYQPLTFIAKHICGKYNVKLNDQEDYIQELLMHVTSVLPDYYDPNKGFAKNACYILMVQRLNYLFTRDNAQKRGLGKTVYIEDMDTSAIYEVSITDDFHREMLLNNKALFACLDGKLEQKIVNKIIKTVEQELGLNATNIAKKCKVKVNKVYYVLSKMRTLMETVND